MATIHTSGSIACFIFGGFLILGAIFFIAFRIVTVSTTESIGIAGIGAGLIALGWYIGVLSKN